MSEFYTGLAFSGNTHKVVVVTSLGAPLDEFFRKMSAIGGQLWATKPVVAAEHVDEEEEGREGGQIWSDSDEDDSDEDSD